jgi:FkbM family methyltransferase
MFVGGRGKLISLKVPGISYPVYIRNQVYDQSTFQQIFVNREYNFEFEGMPSRIIDAGANIGLAAVYFANRFPSAKIVCIEPETENFQLLQKNISQYPNVTALQAGVWSKTAFLKIHDNGLGNWGFTVEECDSNEAGALKAVSVYDVMKQHHFDSVDIIKMDIEGSEKEVLEADDHDQWLSVCGTLVIELHDRMKKGTSSALFRALLPYEVQVEQVGENFLCRILSRKKTY